MSYITIFSLFILYFELLCYILGKKLEYRKKSLKFLRNLLNIIQMLFYYSGIELNLIIIFCDESSIYIKGTLQCWNSEHILYFILSDIYCFFKIILSILVSKFGFTKNDIIISGISKFAICNHVIVYFILKLFLYFYSFFIKEILTLV